VVAAAVAAQQIIAVAAGQRVVVALGQQQVGAGTAGQRVLAAAADRDRHLDAAAVLSIAYGDREDRRPAAPVYGVHGHRPGGAAAAEGDVAAGHQPRVGGADTERQSRRLALHVGHV